MALRLGTGVFQAAPGFVLFEAMTLKLQEAVTGQLMHVQLAPPEEQPLLQPVDLPPMEAHHVDMTTGQDELAQANAVLEAERRGPLPSHLDPRQAPLQSRKAGGGGGGAKGGSGGGAGGVDPSNPATWGRVSRNAPCPCGSGKKFKHCHGKYS